MQYFGVQANDAMDRWGMARESALYRELLAEKQEIMRHKWFMSERAGYDVGFDVALINWVRNHRSDWRAYRKYSNRASRPDRASEERLAERQDSLKQ